MVEDMKLEQLVEACRRLPPAENAYLENDFVMNLLLTVLDYQQWPATVGNAIEHFKHRRKGEIASAEDLKGLLGEYPDDNSGNTDLALHLWGYKFWKRAHQLRGLFGYFESRGVMTQEDLAEWADKPYYLAYYNGEIAKDPFERFLERFATERPKGLGFALCQWLVMRQGAETIKPDSRVRNFVYEATHVCLDDRTLVNDLTRVARHPSMKANELDWRIWEHGGK